MASLYSTYANRRDANRDYNDRQEGRLAALQRQAMMDERQAGMDAMDKTRYANEQVDYAEKKNKMALADVSRREMMNRISTIPQDAPPQQRLYGAAKIAEEFGDFDTAKGYYSEAEKLNVRPGQEVRKDKILEWKDALSKGILSPKEFNALLAKETNIPQPSTYYPGVPNADGTFTQFGRGGQSPLNTGVKAPPPKVGGAGSAGSQKVRPEDVAHARSIITYLNNSLNDNPASTTGLFSPVIRKIEAVGDSISSGKYSSNATIAEQKKESLLLSIKTMFGGKMFDSNVDQQRFEKAVGKGAWATKEGMAEGLKDIEALVNKYYPAATAAPGSSPPASPIDRKAEIGSRFDKLMNNK